MFVIWYSKDWEQYSKLIQETGSVPHEPFSHLKFESILFSILFLYETFNRVAQWIHSINLGSEYTHSSSPTISVSNPLALLGHPFVRGWRLQNDSTSISYLQARQTAVKSLQHCRMPPSTNSNTNHRTMSFLTSQNIALFRTLRFFFT